MTNRRQAGSSEQSGPLVLDPRSPIPTPCGPQNIRIGDRIVGDGQAVYIIAEAGVNHDGSLDDALRLVDVAADAGADACKFQIFSASRLVTTEAAAAAYQQANGRSTQRDDQSRDREGAVEASAVGSSNQGAKALGISARQILERLQLSDGDFARIHEHCRERGIEFLATPFSEHDLDRLLHFEPPAIKLASTDLNNVPLVRRAATTELPLIISTGAAEPGEIAAAAARLREWGALERTVLLHCVSAYPTPLEAANLGAIRELRAQFGALSGYSDHTTSVRTGAWAAAVGACVLEKHFTLDRSRPGPDHAMSLEPQQLRAYVSATRDVQRALGSGRLGLQRIEQDIRRVARRSLVTTRALSAGEALTADTVEPRRPGTGIPPDRMDHVLGRRAVRDIPAETLLAWDMIQ